jgi:hypothetical protein
MTDLQVGTRYLSPFEGPCGIATILTTAYTTLYLYHGHASGAGIGSFLRHSSLINRSIHHTEVRQLERAAIYFSTQELGQFSG